MVAALFQPGTALQSAPAVRAGFASIAMAYLRYP